MILFVPFHHLEYVLPSTYQQVAVIAKSYAQRQIWFVIRKKHGERRV